VLHYYLPKIERSAVLEALSLNPLDYFVLSCHREENVDDEGNFRGLIEVLQGFVAAYGKRIIMTTHPARENGSSRKRSNCRSSWNCTRLQTERLCETPDERLHVLSDSGTITEGIVDSEFPRSQYPPGP